MNQFHTNISQIYIVFVCNSAHLLITIKLDVGLTTITLTYIDLKIKCREEDTHISLPLESIFT